MKIHCSATKYNLKFIDAYSCGGFLFIVTELMDCGSMTWLLAQTTEYPEKLCQYVLYKTLLGIKYLHDR